MHEEVIVIDDPWPDQDLTEEQRRKIIDWFDDLMQHRKENVECPQKSE